MLMFMQGNSLSRQFFCLVPDVVYKGFFECNVTLIHSIKKTNSPIDLEMSSKDFSPKNFFWCREQKFQSFVVDFIKKSFETLVKMKTRLVAGGGSGMVG